MNPFSLEQPTGTRREFLHSVSALALIQTVKPAIPSALKTLGIAYTSFPIRSRQAGQGGEGPAIPAEKFIDLCKSFGSDGCQMAFSQLVSTDEDYLKRLRRAVEDKGMFLELSLGGKVLADAEEFARVASVAQAIGCYPSARGHQRTPIRGILGSAEVEGVCKTLAAGAASSRTHAQAAQTGHRN